MTDYLEGLNEPQRAAVENYTGATLIIAGAGSGKTRVLTMRIAYMLQAGVKPWNILALTFTNKAAREMKERIAAILPPQAIRGMWMGTFHSIFGRILRQEAALLGFPEAFTIYDTADSRNVVKALVKEMELADDRYKPNEVFSRISLAKNNLILPEAYAANTQLLEEDAHAKRPQLYQLYARYMQRCRQNGAMDFDDMLLYMNILLRDHPQVVAKYGEMFQYILVDEYQDTNYSQYLIVKKLASLHHNICVVGDDSQSIYSFRGAKIENILRFQKDYPETRIFKLEQNYRSSSNIVNAANSVIDKNQRKLPKKLFSANEPGDKIKVIATQSDKEEALRVASDIHTTMFTEQASAGDFAVMYRTNSQSRVIEEYLRGKNISYRIYGGHSFFQRAEVKDMIAYLRLAVNPADDESLKRVINFPPRGIGDTSIQRIETAARTENCSMWSVLMRQTPAEMGIRGGAVKSLAAFISNFSDLSQRAGQINAYELAMEVVQRSGVIQHYKLSRAIEDESRLQNTEELLNSIKDYVDELATRATIEQNDEQQQIEVNEPTGSIGEWLAEVALLTDMDNDSQDDTPRVTLLTVHASKGLEFRYTYIVGMEENLFPSSRGVESQENIEEERRLFYVALTRAERRATLSFSSSRFRWGTVVNSNPSRFIREIDSRYIELPRILEYMNTADDEQDEMPGSKSSFGGHSGNSGGSGNAPTWQRRRANSTGGSDGGDTNKTGTNAYGSGNGTNNSGGRNDGGSSRSVGSSQLTPVNKAVPGIVSQTDYAAEAYVVGQRVSHHKFGAGTITQIEATQTDRRISVEFNTVGEKVLLAKFAKLNILD